MRESVAHLFSEQEKLALSNAPMSVLMMASVNDKRAFFKGQQAALSFYGVKTAEDEEPSWFQRHRGALAGAATAAAAPLLYQHLRTRHLSDDPALRAIQEKARGLYTRVMPGSGDGRSRLRKGLDRLLYAGGGNVQYRDDLVAAAKRTGVVPTTSGAVMHDLPGKQHLVGDANMIANEASNVAGSAFNDGDKWVESQIFNHYSPGSMGKSQNVGNILGELGYDLGHRDPSKRARQVKAFSEQMQRDPKARAEMLERLQGRLGQDHSAGYLLKDVDASATGGRFPTDKHRFVDLANQESPEAKTLTNLIRNPHSVMSQEKLPLEQGSFIDKALAKLKGLPSTKEVRVHVMNGAVAPHLTVPRFSHTMWATGRTKMRGAEDYTRNLLKSLPEELSKGTYAMDIAPVHGGGYKLIESNPGYRSGFLNPQNHPLTGPLSHLQFTGQHSKAIAGAGAAAGAVGAGVGIGQLTKKRDEEPV